MLYVVFAPKSWFREPTPTLVSVLPFLVLALWHVQGYLSLFLHCRVLFPVNP